MLNKNMPERFPQTKITADPSKFSLREEALSIEPKGLEKKFSILVGEAGKETMIYIDDKTGEKFHKIDPSLAPSQKLLSLILKGVINVSDVVRVGDDYYSHEQNFDYIEPGKEDIIAEVTADLFIIRRVFKDPDHKYYLKNDFSRARIEKKYPNSVLEHHNLRVDEANKKLNFFDFETYGNDWLHKIKIEKPKYIKKIFKKEFAKKLFSSDLQRSITLDILRKKIDILVSLFSDFVVFKEMLQRSEVELTENEQQIVFNNIMLRLQILSKVLSKIKTKRQFYGWHKRN